MTPLACKCLCPGRCRLLLAIALAASLLGGCTRRDYRLRADRETYGILAEKTQRPLWSIPPRSAEPAPASRNFDPTSPDAPPMPPDDPAAHQYMHQAHEQPGYQHWHDDGDTPTIEFTNWQECLELEPDGTLKLDQSRAVELGLIHSREYQFEVEDLYLDALALTLERFEFDVQWFGTNRTLFRHQGTSSRPTEDNDLTTDSNLGFTRALAGGGQFLVDFANTFVWEFTGKDTTAAASDVTVELVQPLLRGAFREVRLETLTQSERTVLYSARDFARFRKQFYFDVVSGNDGYLSLLLQLQNIRNLETNLVSLQQNLDVHEALAEAGIVSPLQVDQVFQQYQNGRLALIQARNDLETSLDAYKIRLGLPPELSVKLDDTLLAPFELNSPEIGALDQAHEALLAEFRQLDEPPTPAHLQKGFAELQRLQERLKSQLAAVTTELDRWKAQPPTSQDAEQAEREVKLRKQLTDRLGELKSDIEKLGAQITTSATAAQPDQVAWTGLQDLIRRQQGQVSDLFVAQTQIRAHLIRLPDVDWQQEEAVVFALDNRLDLMNERAKVVDEWRRIKVTADGLEADLDVFVRSNLRTDPNTANPLKFSSETSSYRVGLQFDSPLNRLAERNTYRAQLVNYQRARREFISSRDAVVQAVRLDLRQLAANRLNFEIARQSLITAARQVELARVQLLAPGEAGDSSQTQDVLNALNSLLLAKNNLIEIWVTYETNRLQLLLDTEAMQLDESGLLRDEYFDAADDPEPLDVPEGQPDERS